jgi:hypothetical protein
MPSIMSSTILGILGPGKQGPGKQGPGKQGPGKQGPGKRVCAAGCAHRRSLTRAIGSA